MENQTTPAGDKCYKFNLAVLLKDGIPKVDLPYMNPLMKPRTQTIIYEDGKIVSDEVLQTSKSELSDMNNHIRKHSFCYHDGDIIYVHSNNRLSPEELQNNISSCSNLEEATQTLAELYAKVVFIKTV